MLILCRTAMDQWNKNIDIYRLIIFLDLLENVLFTIDPSYIRTANYTRYIAISIYSEFRFGVDARTHQGSNWTYEVWPPQEEFSSSSSGESDND